MPKFLSDSKVERLLLALVAVLVLAGLYLALVYVPNERTMGPVQRIFYFHVASALSAYVAIAVAFVASLFTLLSKRRWCESFQVAGTEVAFMFCTITLCTGMIWGNAAWNTAFRMEPRLVSFLMLWLMLLSIHLLRAFSGSSRVGQLSCVLTIVATFTIPLVVYSVKLLPQTVQLHPQVLGNRGLTFPGYVAAFSVALSAFVAFSLLLVLIRARIEWAYETALNIARKGE